MFRSFFSKLAVTYILIMIAVIVVFSYGTTLLYERNVFEDKKQNLLLSANQVQKLTASYYDGSLSKEELDNQVDTIGYITDSKIYVVKLSKASLENPKNLQLEGLGQNSILKDLEKILDNKTVFQKRQYFEDMDTYVVMLGQPLFIESEIEGAIIFLTPVDKLGSRIAGVRLLVFALALTMALLGVIVIYLNAGRISRPIKDLEHAAMKVAMGDNPEDIDIESKDEIGSLAKTFNHMKNRLAKTEQMRRDFIANVSHDLRTPLTTINGFVQAMLEGLVKPEHTRKYLEIINKETLRLMRLTGDILELAKLEADSIRVCREYVDIGEVLEDARSSMEMQASEKSVGISVSCPQGVRAYADEDRLKQILSNIISNAIKNTDAGGNVYLSADVEGEFVKMSVEDTGAGIPEEDLPYIFEKFYRVDKSRQPENSGTGLGLSIAKKLVELHNGRIQVKSEVNTGTQITIEIPK